MSILFYGNCQLGALKKITNIEGYVSTYICCYNTKLTCEEFLDLIQVSDIIITQPIGENYKSKEYLSTKYIINNCKQSCKVIILDSCYFKFYYPDLTYAIFKDVPLNKPGDYHYNALMNCYREKKPVEKYISDYVEDENFLTAENLETLANKSLSALLERAKCIINTYLINNEKVFYISTHDYIKENYKNKLLFYSINHPCSNVLYFLCEEIINITGLKIAIDYNINVLDTHKGILYKCIQKAVNFNINDFNPMVRNKTNINDIVNLYYDAYKSIGFE
jgi:hypothetical protein